MKTPRYAKISLLVVFLLTVMACRLVSNGSDGSGTPTVSIDINESEFSGGPAPVSILGVVVDPPVGNGEFFLTVEYQISTLRDWIGVETITCSYAAPDGATMEIGVYTPPRPVSFDGTSVTSSVKMPFTATEEGDYTASCQPMSGREKKSTAFKVQSDIRGSGTRVWDGLYTEADPNVIFVSHCSSPVNVTLELRADGTAWMQTLGEGRYGAKCESNYKFHENTEMEWTLTGTYDSKTEIATFTECNNTPGAGGQVSYKDGILIGSAICVANSDPEYGDLKVTITIP